MFFATIFFIHWFCFAAEEKDALSPRGDMGRHFTFQSQQSVDDSLGDGGATGFSEGCNWRLSTSMNDLTQIGKAETTSTDEPRQRIQISLGGEDVGDTFERRLVPASPQDRGWDLVAKRGAYSIWQRDGQRSFSLSLAPNHEPEIYCGDKETTYYIKRGSFTLPVVVNHGTYANRVQQDCTEALEGINLAELSQKELETWYVNETEKISNYKALWEKNQNF